MGSRYGRNRQEIIKGWVGVGFNFRIMLVMYFYSLIFRTYQLIISDLLLEFYYNDYLFNYHIITYVIYIDCVSPKGQYLAGAACCTVHISVFWLTVSYYKISWVRADGHSGILVPQSIYIHINISVWDFIYLSIIAVKLYLKSFLIKKSTAYMG